MLEQKKNAHLSVIDPDFATLVPSVNEAFKHIWTYSSMNEFRGNWTKTRASYPDFVPGTGFTIKHQSVTASDGAEIDMRIMRPKGSEKENLPLLFVLHGGGWVVGGHDSENGMSQSVCVKNHMAVLSVDYRRAPEYHFPTALNDGYDLYKWTLLHASELGLNKHKIVLAGTSAGANLVAGLTLRLRDEGLLGGIIGQLLNIPATCHPKLFPYEQYELSSYTQNAQAPTINGEHMLWFWDQYYPNPRRDPLASPLIAESHHGLPAALIQVAGLDPLRDEGLAYEEALRCAGVPTTLKIYPGLPHGFALAVEMASASEYYRSMVEWTESRLSTIATSTTQGHQFLAQEDISDITATD